MKVPEHGCNIPSTRQYSQRTVPTFKSVLYYLHREYTEPIENMFHHFACDMSMHNVWPSP